MSEELKPCPFCGSKNVDLSYVSWSCLDGGCDNCFIPRISIQISDLMTIEERAGSRSLSQENGYRYEDEYAERAERRAIEMWNQRA